MSDMPNKTDVNKKPSDVDVSSQAASSDSFDAHQVAEAVEEGEQELPSVDVASDYEASKQFNIGENSNLEGEKAIEVAASRPLPDEATESAGDPEKFRKMAEQVQPKSEK
jgi:hypothetical protein